MSNQEKNAEKAAGLTNDELAKLVKRSVPEMKDGKATGKNKQVAIKPGEVLSHKDYGDHVVVVTTDGEKLRGTK